MALRGHDVSAATYLIIECRTLLRVWPTAQLYYGQRTSLVCKHGIIALKAVEHTGQDGVSYAHKG